MEYSPRLMKGEYDRKGIIVESQQEIEFSRQEIIESREFGKSCFEVDPFLSPREKLRRKSGGVNIKEIGRKLEASFKKN